MGLRGRILHLTGLILSLRSLRGGTDVHMYGHLDRHLSLWGRCPKLSKMLVSPLFKSMTMTDRQTDKASYRVTCPQLKTILAFFLLVPFFPPFFPSFLHLFPPSFKNRRRKNCSAFLPTSSLPTFLPSLLPSFLPSFFSSFF